MSKLFTPLKIGSIEIKNRVFMAPMSSGRVDDDGMIGEDLTAYWAERAKGGAGCIILDMMSVDPTVPYLCNTLFYKGEESISGYKKFTDAMHEYGVKVIPQLAHPGAESMSSFQGITPFSSSAYINNMGQKSREMSQEEIAEVVRQFAKTAYYAKQSGFDGIQLHCAHAYMLVASFLSPLRNHRTDCYGGSLDNRARFLFEVLDAIREACGKDFPIILRISGSERVPYGLTLDDTLYLIPRMIEHGVDAFEISGSAQYEMSYKVIPCHHAPDGLNLEEAKAIRKVSTVPVIVVGKVNSIQKAMHWVDNDYVDGVTMGRAFLADPEIVNKAIEERFDEIAPCTNCGVGCLQEQAEGRTPTCVINPFTGKERVMKLERADVPKKVSVIGGGIGGMACCRYLALRGHEVTLYEKSGKLGGQLNLACVAPYKQEMSKWIVYLNKELQRLNVDIRLNTEITREDAEGLNADTVVVASGASPMLPHVDGVAADALTSHDILSGEIAVTQGNILVVGGGMVALEVCEYLLSIKQGSMAITIIEMMDAVGSNMPANNRIPTLIELEEHGVKIMTRTKLLKADGQCVQVECDGQVKTLGPFTDIIYAVGAVSNKAICGEIEGKETYYIGDVNQPRNALAAVQEACCTAMKI